MSADKDWIDRMQAKAEKAMEDAEGSTSPQAGDNIAGQEWFRERAEEMVRQKREREEAQAREQAELEERLRKVHQPDPELEDLEKLEKALKDGPEASSGAAPEDIFREVLRKKIDMAIGIRIEALRCYVGTPRSYEIRTSSGRTERFSKLNHLATWGEARDIFLETEQREIPKLSPREWRAVSADIFALVENIDQGTESSSELIVSGHIDRFLNSRTPTRLDSFRRAKERLRDRDCPVKPRKGDQSGKLRIWIQLEDFLGWAKVTTVAWEFSRNEVANDLRRLKAVPEPIHPGVNAIFTRDTTVSCWGLPPDRFPVPEYCLEPLTIEELQERFSNFKPDTAA